jgi:hypothetical protein
MIRTGPRDPHDRLDPDADPMADDRIAESVLELPAYGRACYRLQPRADVLLELAHLGIRLSEAGFLLRAVERKAADDPPPLRGLSRDLDAWVFAVYGVLDALAHVLVAHAAVETSDEVKFPLLGRILGPGHPLAARLADVLAESWFVELRALRNLVNYRPVLDVPARWPSPAWRDWRAIHDAVCALTTDVLDALPGPPGDD